MSAGFRSTFKGKYALLLLCKDTVLPAQTTPQEFVVQKHEDDRKHTQRLCVKLILLILRPLRPVGLVLVELFFLRVRFAQSGSLSSYVRSAQSGSFWPRFHMCFVAIFLNRWLK